MLNNNIIIIKYVTHPLEQTPWRIYFSSYQVQHFISWALTILQGTCSVCEINQTGVRHSSVTQRRKQWLFVKGSSACSSGKCLIYNNSTWLTLKNQEPSGEWFDKIRTSNAIKAIYIEAASLLWGSAWEILSSNTALIPGTREQACSCLITWLSSPWRFAPLEFLRASSIFSTSTVPSPSASNCAKAWRVTKKIYFSIFP